MNGKQVIDLAASIVNRQEATTRTDIAAFVNSARKNLLRTQRINRLQMYKANVTMTNGVIDMVTQHIKSVRMVEYDDGTQITRLKAVYSRQDASDIYGDFSVTGAPTGYLAEGTSLYILPLPTIGTINIAGEFWPDDISDSTASSDFTTVELGDAWAYLGAALYLDAKGEPEKARAWQEKGMAAVNFYIKQENGRLADTADVWRRWPFGRPLFGRRPATTSDLERGTW